MGLYIACRNYSNSKDIIGIFTTKTLAWDYIKTENPNWLDNESEYTLEPHKLDAIAFA